MAKAVKYFVFFVILLAIALVLFNEYLREVDPLLTLETKHIQIGKAALTAYVADTPEKRTQGLMDVDNLAPDFGMIFIFPDAGTRSFWNKNTLLDLDVIWIAEGKVVGVSSLPAPLRVRDIVTISSPKGVDMVVEVHRGWAETHGITVGDTVFVGE